MYGILHPSCKAIPVGMKNWPYKRGGIYVSGEFSSISVSQQGRIQGGRTPPKIGKNKIFWRKIVIFHTKYPKIFRASLCSAQIFYVRSP
jgi:hypothetical protein